jgi:multicomponent Na+:H+ antiporter subunit B
LHAHEWGIFAVEIGVIVTVCSTLIAIFYAFAGRAKS